MVPVLAQEVEHGLAAHQHSGEHSYLSPTKGEAGIAVDYKEPGGHGPKQCSSSSNKKAGIVAIPAQQGRELSQIVRELCMWLGHQAGRLAGQGQTTPRDGHGHSTQGKTLRRLACNPPKREAVNRRQATF